MVVVKPLLLTAFHVYPVILNKLIILVLTHVILNAIPAQFMLLVKHVLPLHALIDN